MHTKIIALLAILLTFLLTAFPPQIRFLRMLWIGILALMIGFILSGCAIYPIDDGSRAAETTWLVADSIDTLQTYQFSKNPRCFHEADPLAAAIYGGRHPPPNRVLAVNAVLAVVHPIISRWFDEHADAAYEADSDTVGLWYVGRAFWHGVSLLATGSSLANNFERGISPFSEPRCQ